MHNWLYDWLGPTKLKDADFTLKEFGFPEEMRDIGMMGATGVTDDKLDLQTDPEAVARGGWYSSVFFSAVGLIVIGLVVRHLITLHRAKMAV